MRALVKRVARLEQAEPAGQRPALVLIHGQGFDPDSLIGVDGIELQREEDESASAYLARLEAHLRAVRGRALPLVTFAVYPGDDAPDKPDATAVLVSGFS